MTCLLFTFLLFYFQLTYCTQRQAGEYDLFIVYLFISCFPFYSPIVLSMRLDNMTCLLFTFLLFSFQLTYCTQHQTGEYDLFIVYLSLLFLSTHLLYSASGWSREPASTSSLRHPLMQGLFMRTLVKMFLLRGIAPWWSRALTRAPASSRILVICSFSCSLSASKGMNV